MASAQAREDGRTEIVRSWGDLSARVVAIAAVLGMGGAAWNWSSSTMTEMKQTQTKVEGHDATLNRMEQKIDKLNDSDQEKFRILNELKVVGAELKTTADNNSRRLDRIEAKQDARKQAAAVTP